MISKLKDPLLTFLHGIGRAKQAEQSSDRQLLRDFAQQRNEGAFSTLVRRHGAMVLNTCRRHLRNSHDAEDAFQAVFLVLARKAGSVSWQVSVASWLHEVACRVSAEARTKLARQRKRESSMDKLPEPLPGHESALEELSTLLDDCLRSLPDKYRAPLVLCCLEGHSRDEVAEQLGWTLGMVKGRLERGRELLRCKLARRGMTLSLGLSPLLFQPLFPAQAGVALAAIQKVVGLSSLVGRNTLERIPVSTRILADGVIRTMFLSKVTKMSMAALILAILGSGVGLLAHRSFAETNSSRQLISALAQDKIQTSKPAEKPVQPQKSVAGKDDKKAILEKPKLERVITLGNVVRKVAITRDGKFMAAPCFDGKVRLWDTKTGRLIRTWELGGLVSALAISPDGKQICVGNDTGKLVGWDLATGKILFDHITGQENIYDLAFSPDGKTLVSANHLGSVSLWDPMKGTYLRQIAAHNQRVWSVCFHPDSKLFASCGEDGKINLWEAATGKLLRSISAHQGWANAIAFSPNGKLLASCGKDGQLALWTWETGKNVRTIRGEVAYSLDFTANGKKLAAANEFGGVQFWEVATGKKLQSFDEPQSKTYAVAISPSGDLLVSGGMDGKIHVWRLPVDKSSKKKNP